MSRPDSTPLLAPARAAQLLDDVIFSRVVELIDLPRLYDLEAMLALQIEDLGAGIEEARASAKEMVDRALLRLAQTSRKWTRWRPPDADDADDAIDAIDAHDAPVGRDRHTLHDAACERCGTPHVRAKQIPKS